MQLKLKEDPREWRKTVWALAGVLTVLSLLLLWRRVLPPFGAAVVMTCAAVLAGAGAWRPSRFRPLYRVLMTFSFHVSRVVSGVLLTLFFLFAVTPLGLLLRLMGKDLLSLRRRPTAESYWRPAKGTTRLDQAF